MTASRGSPFDGLGERPWLVLGGGGLKGLAHVGALRALNEAGVGIEGVVGTSIGALVGACHAGGMDWRLMDEAARELERSDILKVSRRAVWVNGIKSVSVFRGDALREYIEEVLPCSDWSRLSIPLQVNAVNLETGETEWFGPDARTDAPLADAVYASAALPVIYPPAELGGGHFVDGGTGDALALERAGSMGATGILAVDVGAGPKDDAGEIVERGMIAIHQRIYAIMSGRRRRELVSGWEGLPLLFVRPELEGYSTFDFEQIPYFLEEGYRATRDALGG